MNLFSVFNNRTFLNAHRQFWCYTGFKPVLYIIFCKRLCAGWRCTQPDSTPAVLFVSGVEHSANVKRVLGEVTGELSCVSVKSHNQKWPGTCLYYTFHKSRETCSDTFSTNKKCDIFVGTKNWLNPCDVNWHEKAIIIILEVHFQLPINGNSLKCRPIWQQKLKTVFLGGAGVGILGRDCSWNTANYANRQNHLERQPCSWFLARPR